jgi:hypothetical protein
LSDLPHEPANDLPPAVAQSVTEHFPDLISAARRQLLRYKGNEREQVMMTLLEQSAGNLKALTRLITDRLTVDDTLNALFSELPPAVVQCVLEHFPKSLSDAKRELLRYEGEDREQVMLTLLEQSQGDLRQLSHLVTKKLAATPSTTLPADTAIPTLHGLPHYSNYNEYEIERLFNTLTMNVQDGFKPEDWNEAYDLISALRLSDQANRRLISQSEGRLERLRELIAENTPTAKK